MCLCLDKCVYTVCLQESLGVRKDIIFLEQVSEGCEVPCRCWEAKLGDLQVQQACLAPEPSFQPPFQLFPYAYRE